MSPSRQHEQAKKLLAQILELACLERGIDYCGLGSTTLKDQALERGLEPDECYYLANAGRIKGQKHIDLDVDPPPDLCIEVEITSSLLDKLRKSE